MIVVNREARNEIFRLSHQDFDPYRADNIPFNDVLFGNRDRTVKPDLERYQYHAARKYRAHTKLRRRYPDIADFLRYFL